MKLPRTEAGKLHLIRARLWANIYWCVMEGAKGAKITTNPIKEADDAVLAFDGRFKKNFPVDDDK